MRPSNGAFPLLTSSLAQTLRGVAHSAPLEASKGAVKAAIGLFAFLSTLVNSAHGETDCGVYFAESTIPQAGFGMFAGKNFEIYEQITAGDIVIPLVEMEWHNAFENWNFIWDDYCWSKNSVEGMDEEIPGKNIHAASPGIGAALNCMLPLVNLEATELQLDNAGLKRYQDPGVGAFTPYHDRQSFASKDIEQGAELFIWYGENYFETRSSEYGMVPLLDDFDVADGLLEKYCVLLVKLTETSENVKEALWSLITKKLYDGESRTLNALPRNTSQIPKALRVGTAKVSYDTTVRPIEWLRENGKCMDNLRPGKSIIPQAGRGAFARRFIPKGGLVAPVPLIHIGNKTRLDMYDVLPKDKHGYVGRNTSKIVHTQLLRNYCWGHRDSSLLLSQYGVVTSLINHSSKRPNVKLQWSDTMPNPEWRELSIGKLEKETHAGLAFDLVALEDIFDGEEVLLDYGEEWEAAWNQYVKNWSPPAGSKHYRPAFELNNEDETPVLWAWDTEPYYSPNVDVWCRRYFLEISGMTDLEDYKLLFVRIAERYVVEGEYRYMVERIVQRGNDDDEVTECYMDVLGVAFDLPRSAFVFEDLPYSRDHQLRSTFRHEMMVPDDLFPEAWKNEKELF